MNPQLKKPLLALVSFFLLFLLLLRTSKYYRILHVVSIPQYVYPKPQSFHLNVVDQIRDTLTTDKLESDLKQLIHDLPPSRYYNAKEGKITSDYFIKILNKLSSLTDANIKINEFKHPWEMSSVIVNFKGDQSNDDVVVIGCHMDSINMEVSHYEAPGVDDNLSGVVIALNIIESLIQNSHLINEFKTQLEFHFYSAEEYGSLGSSDVFQNYKSLDKSIIGMLQLDMTGYVQDTLASNLKPHFGLVIDYASNSLIPLINDLVKSYCSIPIRETTCGKVCSDHVSGLIYGYPGIYALESEVQFSNPHRHTHRDTIDLIDFNHIWQHWALGLAFTLELTLNNISTISSYQLFKFKWMDYGILELMHDTKRFIYLSLSFAGMTASVYYIYLEYSDPSPLLEPSDVEQPQLDQELEQMLPKKSRRNKAKKHVI